jgi:hypothetical protein
MKSPNQKKQPSQKNSGRKFDLSCSQIPRKNLDPGSSHNQTPAWSFTKIDYDGTWGWNDVHFAKHKEEIFEKLSHFESMTWAEILKAKKNHHAIDIDKLHRDAQKRLEALELNDIDELMSLRLTGEKRVFGIRDGRVLQLLWYDPEHEVCPSALKHT